MSDRAQADTDKWAKGSRRDWILKIGVVVASVAIMAGVALLDSPKYDSPRPAPQEVGFTATRYINGTTTLLVITSELIYKTGLHEKIKQQWEAQNPGEVLLQCRLETPGLVCGVFRKQEQRGGLPGRPSLVIFPQLQG